MRTAGLADDHPSSARTPRPLSRLSRTIIAMDTLVTVHVDSARPADELDTTMDAALAWFEQVERICSRFDPDSELARLCAQPGGAVPVSDLLFEAVAFALHVAELSGGAFDPTVGGAQQARGFTHNYMTGHDVEIDASPATHRHVRLDRGRRTITLLRPLLLDLGAVAKGLAIDLAARTLAGLERFAVEAGGDLYAGGSNGSAPAWRVGIRHPRHDSLIGSLTVRNRAVCTSGGAERPAALPDSGHDPGEHHLLDPHTGRSPRGLAGVSVVAHSAMVADALATAAFVLGPKVGARLLEKQGVGAVLVTAADEVRVLPGHRGDWSWSASHD